MRRGEMQVGWGWDSAPSKDTVEESERESWGCYKEKKVELEEGKRLKWLALILLKGSEVIFSVIWSSQQGILFCAKLEVQVYKMNKIHA